MSHPEQSTTPVLASPTAAIRWRGRWPQRHTGTRRSDDTGRNDNRGKREGQGTRWVKGRAGHAPPRSRPGPRPIHPRVATRGGPRAHRRHPKRTDPPPRSTGPKRPSGPRTDGGPGRGRRRGQESGRRRSGGPGRRRAARLPASGRRLPSTARRVPSPGRALAGVRGTGTRIAAARGTGTRGTGSGRTLGTRPETGGGRGTACGGLIRDRPILIRRRRDAGRSRRTRGAPARKPFARGVPITQRIRRSPARRQPQTRGLLGILTENGARKG